MRIKLLLLVGLATMLAQCTTDTRTLPYFGLRDAVTKTVDGKQVTDTVYHTIPDFAFTNQDGQTITQEDYKGKIYITDFFFTTCPTICPKMTTQLTRVEELTRDMDNVMILSHTVDPEKDTVEALKEYAERIGANTKRWNFVTGNKEALYTQGVKGYLISAREDVLAPGGFLHSEMFVLVDQQRHIRGFYDGTSTEQVDQLMEDLKVLQQEIK